MSALYVMPFFNLHSYPLSVRPIYGLHNDFDVNRVPRQNIQSDLHSNHTQDLYINDGPEVNITHNKQLFVKKAFYRRLNDPIC